MGGPGTITGMRRLRARGLQAAGFGHRKEIMPAFDNGGKEDAMFGYICLARNQYGTLSVVGPAFVNREVTLKARPFFPWGCDVEWKYMMEDGTQFQTMKGRGVIRYSEDGSFFLKWEALTEYNRSNFYAGCSTNATIRSNLISLNVKEIVGQCGALVLLSPVVRGADVKLGYFPSDYSLRHKPSTRRTWKKNIDDIELRESLYEEAIVSEYLYILTILNFEKRHEGMYILYCNFGANTDSVQLHIQGDPTLYLNTTSPVDLPPKTTMVVKDSQSHEKDIQTSFSTFRFPINNVLIGTSVFCGFCILIAIGRCIFLKQRKDNAVNTIKIVENQSDTASDKYVLHMETERVQYAIVQRTAATQRIETQQQRDDNGLTYAELDIMFLQEANARVPARRRHATTEYADIKLSSTQEPALEDPVSHSASTLC